MSFTAQRAKQNNQGTLKSTSEYLREYLLKDVVDSLEAIKDRYVIHLFEDLAGIETPFNFKEFLQSDYDNANEQAGTCLSFAIKSQNLFPKFIPSWTDSALKCFDHFLLIYIQDVRKELIRRYQKVKETDVYRHLIDLGGDDLEIGQAFSTIYQYRNEFQHVQYEEIEGRRVIRRTSGKKLVQRKMLIIGEFKKAFGYFHLMINNNN